ncbi:MAG TPA: hypothetical protein VGM78_03345 [Ilumatobacteraceae bacterium]
MAERSAPSATLPPMWLRAACGLIAGIVVVAASWDASDLGESHRRWAVVATIAVAVAVGVALPRARELMPAPGMMPFVIGTSLVAIYGCVPETGQIPEMAVVVVVVTLIEVASRSSLAIGWHGATAALVMWAGLYGATGQQRAIVGALFAFWPVVIVPLVTMLRPSLAEARQIVRWTVAGIASVAAVIVARTGALQPRLRPAVVSVLQLAGISAALAIAVAIVGPRVVKASRP